MRMLLVLTVLCLPLIARADVTTAQRVHDQCATLQPCLTNLGFADFCQLAGSSSGAIGVAVDNSRWKPVVIPKKEDFFRATCAPSKVATSGLSPAEYKDFFSSFQLNQSALAWGITDFLVSRAKAELNAWISDGALKAVCENKAAQIGSLAIFENSCKYLTTFGIPDSSTTLASFQEAMRKDFHHLPISLLMTLQSKHPELNDAIYFSLLAAQLSESVLAGESPEFALISQEIFASVHPSCSASPAVAVLTQLSGFLRTLPRKPSGIQLPKTNASIVYSMMAMALDARARADSVGGPPRDCGLPGAADNTVSFNPELIFNVVVQLRDRVVKVNEALTRAVQTSADATATTRLAAAARLISALDGLLMDMLASANDYAPIPQYEQTLKAMKALESITNELVAANYSKVLFGLAELAVACGGAAIDVKLPPEVTRLLSFGAEFAQARDVDSAQAAVTRLAAPVGSYRRKRQAKAVYLGVNAYVGGAVNVEWAKQADDSWSSARAGFTPGFWASIGLEIGGARGGASLGLYVQAIDLGTLASWRFSASDEQLKNRPEVGFKQVFAPGAFFVVGIPKAPVSVALGASLAPALRSLTDAVATSSNSTGDAALRDAIRLGLNVAVDIPIFP